MYIIVANVARKDNEVLIQTTVVSRSSIWSNALFGPPPPSKSGLVFRWMRAHWPIASGPEYGPSIHCFYSKWIVIFPFKSGFDDPPNLGRICCRSFCLSCASILILTEPKRRECRSKIAKAELIQILDAKSCVDDVGARLVHGLNNVIVCPLYSQLSMWR